MRSSDIFLSFSLLCIAIAGTALPGCVNHNDRRAWTGEDGWYRPVDSSFAGTEWQPIPDEQVWEVRDSLQARMQERLAEHPVVPLSRQEAAAAVEGYKAGGDSLQPYLVRALYLNYGTGGFSLYRSGTSLAAVHSSLGKSAVPMKRRALVILLPVPPQELYIEVFMDE